MKARIYILAFRVLVSTGESRGSRLPSFFCFKRPLFVLNNLEKVPPALPHLDQLLGIVQCFLNHSLGMLLADPKHRVALFWRNTKLINDPQRQVLPIVSRRLDG